MAPARADGRPRHVHRRRTHAAPDRTRHHTVLLPGPSPVSATPERLSLPGLATLCDSLDCTPTDLIATSAQNLPARRAAGEEAPINLAARRPTRVRLTPEEYERWMIRDCARCGRRASKSAEWSDGPIFRTCYERAMRDRGRCPCCDTDRLLPGRDTDGTPTCRDCAGIVGDFFCDRCGFEGLLLGGRLCEHCALADTLAWIHGSLASRRRRRRQRRLSCPKAPCGIHRHGQEPGHTGRPFPGPRSLGKPVPGTPGRRLKREVRRVRPSAGWPGRRWAGPVCAAARDAVRTGWRPGSLPGAVHGPATEAPRDCPPRFRSSWLMIATRLKAFITVAGQAIAETWSWASTAAAAS
ncbi:helix-turn-helix domain-containing protein [Streptomyces avermitilis]|uniref:helix-turn-helix domain-containing protein n=1 Tax=Streptomyces avermitilis TaxID=33903 RepID=UPI003F54241E